MHLRGIANSITTTTNWLFNYLLSAIFLIITSTEAGKLISYTILGLSCFVAYYFVYLYVPETKGCSLDECVRLVQLTQYYHVGKTRQVTVEDIELKQKIADTE